MLSVTSSVVVLLVSMLVVSDAAKLQFAAESQSCPGDSSTCDPENTCCQNKNGDWGCCRFKDAVCCSDGAHCCPQGTRCNVDQTTCDPVATNVSVPAVPKPSLTTPAPQHNVGLVCPDHSSCAYAGAACCRRYTSGYGCCVYPTNVCCDDGLHCCPSGTICDQLHLQCLRYPSTERIQMTKLTESRDVTGIVDALPSKQEQAEEQKAEVVYCPDGTYCPDYNTCCPYYTGGYGCCPMIAAVCCPDKQHCCASGYTCSSTGDCTRSSDNHHLPWVNLATKP